jgi:hypothetical protein
MRNCSWIRGSVLLALAAGMALLQSDGNAGQQQNNGFAAAAWPLNVRAPMPASPIWRGLNYVIETRDFQQELSLKELLSIVYERLHSDGIELPVTVNAEAFKKVLPDTIDVFDTKVIFPPLPPRMKVAKLLREAVAKIRGADATYIVLQDRVEVTTKEHAGIKWLLGESVVGNFQDMPAVEVLNALSSEVGCTIVIDKRAATEAGKQVTVVFRGDATLGGAVRAVTDMAGLKVLILDGILYVTTSSHADDLRKEAPAAADDEDSLWPDWRRLPQQGAGGKKQDGVE